MTGPALIGCSQYLALNLSPIIKRHESTARKLNCVFIVFNWPTNGRRLTRLPQSSFYVCYHPTSSGIKTTSKHTCGRTTKPRGSQINIHISVRLPWRRENAQILAMSSIEESRIKVSSQPALPWSEFGIASNENDIRNFGTRSTFWCFLVQFVQVSEQTRVFHGLEDPCLKIRLFLSCFYLVNLSCCSRFRVGVVSPVIDNSDARYISWHHDKDNIQTYEDDAHYFSVGLPTQSETVSEPSDYWRGNVIFIPADLLWFLFLNDFGR